MMNSKYLLVDKKILPSYYEKVIEARSLLSSGKIQDVSEAVKEVGEEFRIHDFRCVAGPTHTNLIFDVEIPFEEKRSNKEISTLIEVQIKNIDATYFAVLNVDRV